MHGVRRLMVAQFVRLTRSSSGYQPVNQAILFFSLGVPHGMPVMLLCDLLHMNAPMSPECAGWLHI